MNILITGASSGIGAELAARFSSPGNNLILTGRALDRLERVRSQGEGFEPGEYGWDSCKVVDGDLTDPYTLIRIEEQVRESFGGKLDLLILSAGVYDKRDLFAEPESFADAEVVGEVIKGTLLGNLEVCLQCLPELQAAKGQIVHINSVAGKNISPGEAVYSAAKHAMTGFLKSLRLDARNHGVRVMDVFLGGVDTPMTCNRVQHEKLMAMRAVVSVIKSNIELNHMQSLQIEELQLGRMIF